MENPPPPLKSAFSLVELSIVLVILGLLTGGILAGQSLIRAAELRSVSSDIQRYITATSAFRDKYFSLPGDMTNAISFWGTDATSCPNGGGATGTCNGNGDGIIGAALVTSCENQEYWRQLSLAGLIEGKYTPNTATGCYAAMTFGSQIPKTRLGDGAVTMAFLGTVVASGVYPGNAFYPGSYGNAFVVGTYNTVNVNYLTVGYLLRPEEAWNIDTKLDDGKPGYGIVTVPIPGAYNGNCATSATASAADYSLTVTSVACPLIVKSGY
ncbi:MAG: type II secretion system protein [Rickettsiales bacterium]